MVRDSVDVADADRAAVRELVGVRVSGDLYVRVTVSVSPPETLRDADRALRLGDAVRSGVKKARLRVRGSVGDPMLAVRPAVSVRVSDGESDGWERDTVRCTEMVTSLTVGLRDSVTDAVRCAVPERVRSFVSDSVAESSIVAVSLSVIWGVPDGREPDTVGVFVALRSRVPERVRSFVSDSVAESSIVAVSLSEIWIVPDCDFVDVFAAVPDRVRSRVIDCVSVRCAVSVDESERCTEPLRETCTDCDFVDVFAAVPDRVRSRVIDCVRVRCALSVGESDRCTDPLLLRECEPDAECSADAVIDALRCTETEADAERSALGSRVRDRLLIVNVTVRSAEMERDRVSTAPSLRRAHATNTSAMTAHATAAARRKLIRTCEKKENLTFNGNQ